MTFSLEQKKALEAPLDRNVVKERNQAGRTFSYIEGWWAIKEANRIFGHSEWDRKTDLSQLGDPELGKDKYGNDQWRVRYMAKSTISVIAGERIISRDGVGYGSGIAKDLGDAFESAIKEAETDAMKRALMTFGNPFGLALYDKAQAEVANVEQEAPKNSAYSLKKNGQWEDFMERLSMKDDPDEARAWWLDKMKPWAIKNGWPDPWIVEAESEIAKHCNSLFDRKASVA